MAIYSKNVVQLVSGFVGLGHISGIAVIYYNDIFAPFLFQSLCEFISDCFDASVFCFGSSTPSEKYLSLKQLPTISHKQ